MMKQSMVCHAQELQVKLLPPSLEGSKLIPSKEKILSAGSMLEGFKAKDSEIKAPSKGFQVKFQVKDSK